MYAYFLYSKNYWIVFAVSLFLFSSCNHLENTKNIPMGWYQFQIHRDDGQLIPFLGEVKDSANTTFFILHNGKHQLATDSILVMNDSVWIELPYFESAFSFKVQNQQITDAFWVKRSADEQRWMPMTIHLGEKKRFGRSGNTNKNITGRWETEFVNEKRKLSAIGELNQEGDVVYGTFLTPYGDYRFLEGIIVDDTLLLSGFDGSYALYFTAVVENDSTLKNGKFYSGNAAAQQWTAFKNEHADFSETESIVNVVQPNMKISFSYPDLEGKLVTNEDDYFKDKAIVLQILGSWCPNCIDETQFLIEQYKKYDARKVAFVGIAFERTDNYEKSLQALAPFKNKIQPPYPILIPPVSVSDPEKEKKVLPQIERISAYPTTIFIGKDRLIKKVHAGFDGPATGKHYENYQLEFAETMRQLLGDAE